jgi:hypothetical protein
MDEHMILAHKHLDRTRAITLSLAAALILALLAPGITLAASRTTTSPYTYTQPKFPKPATERVQPGAVGTTVNPTGATVAPTTTNTLPRTTTAPAGVTPTITTTTPTTTTTSTPTGVGARHGATSTSAGSSGPSTPAIAAAVIAALLALGCGVWSVARLQAYEPRWTLSMRHSIAEARFRASATWAEFSDWARLGR